jgi:hypothetical protein
LLRLRAVAGVFPGAKDGDRSARKIRGSVWPAQCSLCLERRLGGLQSPKKFLERKKNSGSLGSKNASQIGGGSEVVFPSLTPRLQLAGGGGMEACCPVPVHCPVGFCPSVFTTLLPVSLLEQYRCGSFVRGAQIAEELANREYGGHQDLRDSCRQSVIPYVHG